jgi:hypothetical protein
MQLTKEPELLRKVLMFHGVDGIKYSSMLSDELEVESLVMDAKIRINIYNNPKPVFKILIIDLFEDIVSRIACYVYIKQIMTFHILHF